MSRVSTVPCRSCDRPVVLVRKGEDRQAWDVVNVDPVKPGRADAHMVRIVEGRIGWLLRDLEEDLMMRAGRGAPTTTTQDYPWHLMHRCEVRATEAGVS